MQKYPEVWTRSRTVQRASGGTRRRVQIEDTVFARVNTAEKLSALRARQKNRSPVYQGGSFRVEAIKPRPLIGRGFIYRVEGKSLGQNHTICIHVRPTGFLEHLKQVAYGHIISFCPFYIKDYAAFMHHNGSIPKGKGMVKIVGNH
ncbi:hypothetical protein SAMN05443529_13825 [Desulfosporosinus hippei DSM 8344]|uniref:Uncharacterized protein n=1 Tax=Desulfosporosinus hippei DSM 8344 TaxID=1121419 RepID=A0A1G8KGQ3_9FIRM|nr:hypothetical protein SAMN05443529_13825 [Desulfosporosinus hippei DSM 8344]